MRDDANGLTPMIAVFSAITTIGGVITFGAFLIDKYFQYGLGRYVAPFYIYIFLSFCLLVVLAHGSWRLYQRIQCFLCIPVFLNNVSIHTSSISIKLMEEIEQGHCPELNYALKETCGPIASFFERLTHCQCAVCIKLLVNKHTGEPHVRTLVRDATSDLRRRAVDNELKSYPYTHNTAFNQIITRNDSCSFFVSNNLTRLRKRKGYRNQNVNWQDYYNAALVVPIAATDNPGLKDATGFLCVDSMKGGFSKYVMPHVLSVIAKQLYFVLTLNDRVLSQFAGRPAEFAVQGGRDGAKVS